MACLAFIHFLHSYRLSAAESDNILPSLFLIFSWHGGILLPDRSYEVRVNSLTPFSDSWVVKFRWATRVQRRKRLCAKGVLQLQLGRCGMYLPRDIVNELE